MLTLFSALTTSSASSSANILLYSSRASPSSLTSRDTFMDHKNHYKQTTQFIIFYKPSLIHLQITIHILISAFRRFTWWAEQPIQRTPQKKIIREEKSALLIIPCS